MPTTVFEIVETGDGEYVLQRADSNDEPLVAIRFSEQANVFLGGSAPEVAKNMIEAGIRHAEHILEDMQDVSDDPNDLAPQRVLH